MPEMPDEPGRGWSVHKLDVRALLAIDGVGHATHRLVGGNRGVRPGIVNSGGTVEMRRRRSETPMGVARAIAAQWGQTEPQTLF